VFVSRITGIRARMPLFIKDGKVIDGRYAVQTDACNTQTYAVFDAMGPTRAGVLGPLY
jgi:hypothetical protein